MFNRLAIVSIVAFSLLTGSAVAPSSAEAKPKSASSGSKSKRASSGPKSRYVKPYTTKKGKSASGYFRSNGKRK